MFKLIFLCLLFGVFFHAIPKLTCSEEMTIQHLQRAKRQIVRAPAPTFSMNQAIELLGVLVELNNQTEGLYFRQNTSQRTQLSSLREIIYEKVTHRADNQPIELPRYVKAEIRYDNTRNNRPPITRAIRDHLKRMDIETNDDAGHIIAVSLGGLTVKENFVPMARKTNQHGLWYKDEQRIREFLQNNRGGQVSWEILIFYPENRLSYRPTRFALRLKFFTDYDNLVGPDPMVECYFNTNEESRNRDCYLFTEQYNTSE